ncbi:hypothetical protein SAMN05216188_1195 [Lentzea xinjiangensis]|uniref:Ig-like domain-containing protein n=1 Tax=Lentzea xinjiangensis TaxID=402600 RepID=A0A1H9TQK0_9PSEU|nr:hypothetical protein [Lentzea xinjiangensis]SER99269.1 hypothetical protein SAMN05216188_1195 [Lentzea xinjiangensis]
MSKRSTNLGRRIRIGALALFTVLSSAAASTVAHLPAASAQPLPLNTCASNVDTYTFAAVVTPSKGIRTFPQDTRFSGDGGNKGRCVTGPQGAQRIKLESASGQGVLGCGVSAGVTGDMKWGWYLDDVTRVDTSTVELETFEFAIVDPGGGGSVSKVVTITGQVTAGAYSPGRMSVTYTSFADSTLCESTSGLVVSSGPADEVTFTGLSA